MVVVEIDWITVYVFLGGVRNLGSPLRISIFLDPHVTYIQIIVTNGISDVVWAAPMP